MYKTPTLKVTNVAHLNLRTNKKKKKKLNTGQISQFF